MFYIIGQEKYRKQWLNERMLPYFEYENMQSKNVLVMWNSKNDDAVALIVDLVPFDEEAYTATYTVAVYDDETGGYYNEEKYSTYIDAYRAYCQIELAVYK